MSFFVVFFLVVVVFKFYYACLLDGYRLNESDFIPEISYRMCVVSSWQWVGRYVV